MNLKKIAGEAAAELIDNGMIVGLGTGSTATYFIKRLGERVKDGLDIIGVSTSSISSKLAQSLHIPLRHIDDVEYIDVTVDGADEVDPQFNGIKGGGGALLFEKIVAKTSKRNIWVVDPSKEVNTLGAFPVPVEVIPFGYKHVIKKLEEMNLNPALRIVDGKEYRTDSNNLIVDIHVNQINDAEKLCNELNSITGAIENGLFIGVVDTVIIGEDGEPIIKQKHK